MDNIDYNNKKDENKVSSVVGVPKSGDSVGIRATLNNMGFSDSSIGFNNERGTVTLNGRDLMKPKYYDDNAGITYSPAADIQKSLVDYHKSSSNPIVRVSDAYAGAAGKYGLSADALSYSNGTVSIGGVPLNTLYIDDSGKAWARQDDVTGAVKDYANKLGVESPTDLYDRFDDEYLSDIRSRINSLNNRKEFSYDPDSDPAYIAYRNKYLTEGDRAGRNAVANYSALTGGYANSAAATAGALANSYYAQQLTDKIPELAAQAYQRYSDSYQAEISVLGRMIDMYDKAYQNAMTANRLAVQNGNDSAASVVQRDKDAYERERLERADIWNDKLNQQKLDEAQQAYNWLDVLNSQKYIENNYQIQTSAEKLEQQRTYNEYYAPLLEAEVAGKQLSNKKTKAEIYAKYGI